MANVAVYQNDGTKKIKPSHFVERAARSKREWHHPLRRAIDKYLDGREDDLSRVARIIARDINEKCDRIKTARLTHSFVHRILK